MNNSIGHHNSIDSITLVYGTATEISQAVKQLGASGATIAKASTSFDFIKIPGAQVSRVEGWFQIGKAFLPEIQNITDKVTEGTRGKFAELLAKNNQVVVNDQKFLIAA